MIVYLLMSGSYSQAQTPTDPSLDSMIFRSELTGSWSGKFGPSDIRITISSINDRQVTASNRIAGQTKKMSGIISTKWIDTDYQVNMELRETPANPENGTFTLNCWFTFKQRPDGSYLYSPDDVSFSGMKGTWIPADGKQLIDFALNRDSVVLYQSPKAIAGPKGIRGRMPEFDNDESIYSRYQVVAGSYEVLDEAMEVARQYGGRESHVWVMPFPDGGYKVCIARSEDPYKAREMMETANEKLGIRSVLVQYQRP